MYFEFEQPPRQGGTWSPAIDVCERATEIVIFVEMPGVERSDVQLSWNDGVLTIAGQKRQNPPGRLPRWRASSRTIPPDRVPTREPGRGYARAAPSPASQRSPAVGPTRHFLTAPLSAP